MAKHHLDSPQVGSAFEQVRGERVAQHRGADRRAYARAPAVPRDHLPEPDAADWAAPRVEEQARVTAPCRPRPGGEQLSAAALVLTDPLGGLAADRNQP